MRNEYPRPDAVRDSFVSLDKKWDFAFDDENVGHVQKWFINHVYDMKIEVPYAFQAKLSGIGDTKFHDHVWYHLTLGKIELLKDERYMLHFEGIDYLSEIYLNGFLVKTHYGSEGAIVVDVTDYLNDKNELTVYAFDPSTDRSIPRGKQDWQEESHGIFYTRTTGIYKSVWAQIVNKSHIKNFYVLTKIDGAIKVDLETTINQGKVEFIVSDEDGKEEFYMPIEKNKADYEFKLCEEFIKDKLWEPGNPHLFDLTINLYDYLGRKVDTVKSYLGIREVEAKDGYVLINKKPVYQKLLLNQGYYIEGILTAPSIEFMEEDIDNMMKMGFNGCRIHQKVEEPYFLYLCDKKGFLVWQECPAHFGFSNYNQRRLLNGWIDIIKNNFNHPSIIAYTPLNESWGVEGIPENKQIQHFAQSLYYMIHSMDESRLVSGNDGWEECTTDLLTAHNYSHGQENEVEKYQKFVADLKDRDTITAHSMINRYIINPGFEDEGQPIILSEFGGVAFVNATKTEENKRAWGYTTCLDGDDFIKELTRIYTAIANSNCIVGVCYTQYTDVEQEVNGMMTYDRKFKVDPERIKAINDMLQIK